MPDGHDEWEWVNKDEEYRRLTGDNEYDNNSYRNRKIKEMIYGTEEYQFNGGN